MPLTELLPLHTDPSVGVREGIHWLLSFLPLSFGIGGGGGSEFSDYIEDVLPVVVTGLSDDHENVRDVALRAGQVSFSHVYF